LGLFQEEMRSPELGDLAENLLDLIVELRAQLRKEKNFALADKIREKLFHSWGGITG
jgi:cysteinyl-tRNA synthetase